VALGFKNAGLKTTLSVGGHPFGSGGTTFLLERILYNRIGNRGLRSICGLQSQNGGWVRRVTAQRDSASPGRRQKVGIREGAFGSGTSLLRS
jgi:hypothetical protein